MRYVLVENDIVTSVIEAPQGYVAPFGQAIATDEAGIGWKWEDGQFVPPEVKEQKPHLPDLTARQFWQAALYLGITEEGLAASITDPTDTLYIEDDLERVSVLIDIRKAQVFKRDYPLVVDVATAQSIPTEQMDALWLWASQIE